MILSKTLKKLLEQVPDDAQIKAYEGEDVGICINFNNKDWWVRCRESDEIDNYTIGFNVKNGAKNVR